MRKEFQAERLKMKRKHTFLLFAACYGLAAAWMLYAVTDLDFGRFNDFAALAACNLLMIASIFSPVLIAAYASRLADVEQYGNCYKWIACLQTPASIWNAKALSGLSHILLYTLAQTLLLAAVCGYFREPSLSLYVQVFLDLLLTCAALFFLQLWLSICSKSQLVPLFVSIAGTFGGIFSWLLAFPLRYLIPWGYYSALCGISMYYDQETRYTYYDIQPFPWAWAAVLALAAAALYLFCRRAFLRQISD